MPIRIMLLALLLAAPVARAAPAEEAYAKLVERIAAVSTKRAGPAGTTTWAGEPTKAAQVRELAEAAEAAWQAIAKAPAAQRPRALELDRKLGGLRRALQEAAGFGVDPGRALHLVVELKDDGGGWDSVIFGGRAYPAVGGELTMALVVPDRWNPARGGPEELKTACPRGVFEFYDPRVLVEDPEELSRYVEETKALAVGVLHHLGRTQLPAALFVLAPPDPARTLAVVPAAAQLPFRIQYVPVKQWAGEDLPPRPTLEHLKAFRKAFNEQISQVYARDYLANCALMLERLVSDPLGPAVEKALSVRRETMLAPMRRQTALFELALRETAAPTSKITATVPRGEEVEVLEGLEPVVGSKRDRRVTTAEFVKIRDQKNHVGWIDSMRRLDWLAGTRTGEESLKTLGREGPASHAGDGAELERLAGAYVLGRETAKHFRAEKVPANAEEADAQAVAALFEFCRLKALVLAQSGKPALDGIAQVARQNRIDAGETHAAAEGVLKETFGHPRCGPLTP